VRVHGLCNLRVHGGPCVYNCLVSYVFLLVQSSGSTTQNEFVRSETIGDIPDPIELFAEEVLREEEG